MFLIFCVEKNPFQFQQFLNCWVFMYKDSFYLSLVLFQKTLLRLIGQVQFFKSDLLFGKISRRFFHNLNSSANSSNNNPGIAFQIEILAIA